MRRPNRPPLWYRAPRALWRRSLFWREPKPRAINLLGDRDIEWSWVAARVGRGPGKALDFGNGGSALGLLLAQAGYQATAIDLEPYDWPYEHPDLTFLRADLLDGALEENSFDLVINCSTVEHVGLVGRYTVSQPKSNGDLDAMAQLRKVMKRGAHMLLTVPVGRDSVFAPMHRVYGVQRLPLLLADFDIDEEAYWIKNPENRWVPASRDASLDFEPYAGSRGAATDNAYALGCFVLRKAATG